MISPPWILGIYGGVRASNVLGTNSSFTVADSTIESGSWAVISTDDCSTPTVNVINSTLKITEYDGTDETGNDSSTSMNGGAALFGYSRNYGSGYGTYNIETDVTLTGAVSSTSAVHGLPYTEEAVAYLDELAAEYGEGIAPNGGDACTVKYTLLDADDNVTEDAANAAYIQVNEFTMNEYYIISHVINKIMSGANVLVTLEEGAVWNVTEDCYIKGLVNYGTINIADGVTLYVNGEPYDGTSVEAGELSADGSIVSVDSSDWVIGQTYRNECMGKYSSFTLDGQNYYIIGATQEDPASGAVITDVAFALVGWLVVNEDGSMTISDTYVEMEVQGGMGGPGGDMGGGTRRMAGSFILSHFQFTFYRARSEPVKFLRDENNNCHRNYINDY